MLAYSQTCLTKGQCNSNQTITVKINSLLQINYWSTNSFNQFQFEDGIATLGNAHKFSTLSLSSFPTVAHDKQ